MSPGGQRERAVILIGRKPDAIDAEAERLLDGCIIAMQDFDTDTLLAIAARREEINPGGWSQRMIWGYVEVWR